MWHTNNGSIQPTSECNQSVESHAPASLSILLMRQQFPARVVLPMPMKPDA